MTRQALTGARLACTPDADTLLIANGRIAGLCSAQRIPADYAVLPLEGGILAPGFIDVQVNGGGGVLFNDAPTVETIAAIGAAHRRFGTTGFLPTLISDDLDKVDAAIAAVEAAIAAGVPGVLGIHLEGPYLNASKRGIHDAGKFRTLHPTDAARLTRLRSGVTLITLAPETVAAGSIAALVERGAIVAAGHSDASYEQMQAAIAEGLSGVTHLFNAMTQLGSRAPGIVGAVFDLPDLTAGMIVDGAHLHPASVRTAFRQCSADRLMLVTDGMPSVGAASAHFQLYGETIEARGGACYNAAGTLAGSNLDMALAVRTCAAQLGVPLDTVLPMASRTPARFLGMADTRGALRPELAADLIWLSDAGDVRATWINGVRS
jgi:N-acetylglucosamine-6-phosphate deacetylase